MASLGQRMAAIGLDVRQTAGYDPHIKAVETGSEPEAIELANRLSEAIKLDNYSIKFNSQVTETPGVYDILISSGQGIFTDTSSNLRGNYQFSALVNFNKSTVSFFNHNGETTSARLEDLSLELNNAFQAAKAQADYVFHESRRADAQALH